MSERETHQPRYALFCNICGVLVPFPERGIIPFDGRFCGQDCKNAHELLLAKWIMRHSRHRP